MRLPEVLWLTYFVFLSAENCISWIFARFMMITMLLWTIKLGAFLWKQVSSYHVVDNNIWHSHSYTFILMYKQLWFPWDFINEHHAVGGSYIYISL
jgi:hypothetical protein